MTTHPRIEQLRFTRRELQRAFAGVTEEEASHRLMPMNCLSWIVGHLAGHEYRYWILRGLGEDALPIANTLAPYGQPATTPSLAEAWQIWQEVIELADPYLDGLTTDQMETRLTFEGKPHFESIGSMVQRVTYHSWYHIGESQAIRQLLGHTGLPEFVAQFGDEAAYRSEAENRS